MEQPTYTFKCTFDVTMEYRGIPLSDQESDFFCQYLRQLVENAGIEYLNGTFANRIKEMREVKKGDLR